MSSGGLVSALSGCKKKMSFTWIGWPGKDVSDRSDLSRFLLYRGTRQPFSVGEQKQPLLGLPADIRFLADTCGGPRAGQLEAAGGIQLLSGVSER